MDLDRLAIPKQFALIGLQYTINDFDKCTFTRAIFPQKGMDFARFNTETDIVIRQTARKRLGHAAHFKLRWLCPLRYFHACF